MQENELSLDLAGCVRAVGKLSLHVPKVPGSIPLPVGKEARVS